MNNQVEKIKKWLGAGSINVFGPQFSGKDTQCVKLAELFDGVKLSSGEILRSTQDAQKTQAEMAKGNLAPTDSFREIVLPYFSKKEFADKPLFLSSIGRMKGEEGVVYDATVNSGHPTKAVVVVNLSHEETMKRFKFMQENDDRGGRDDDSLEALQRRLELYQNDTLEVIRFYRQKGLVVEVNGGKSREEVTNDIIDALAELA